MKLTIRTKLLMGFGVVLLLTTALGGSSLVQLGAFNENTSLLT